MWEGKRRLDNDPKAARYGCFLPDLTGLAGLPSAASLPGVISGAGAGVASSIPQEEQADVSPVRQDLPGQHGGVAQGAGQDDAPVRDGGEHVGQVV